MQASISNYKQSPRKVRLIANLVKGKRVSVALTELAFLAKRGALPVKKLIDSAVANAINNLGIASDNLYIKEIRVDKGIVMHRRMPRARGSAFPIKKRTSHLIVVLAEKEAKKEKKAVKVSTKAKKVTKAKAAK